MRLVFMGTPGFAASILEDIIEHHDVVAVYTRPDAVRGRGKQLMISPVKRIGLERGLSVYSPASLKDDAALIELAAFEPDVICVAAYGLILPKTVLDIPRLGCLNVHASLLPRWRGAAPVERAILADEKETGVCVMRMEEGLDTGDYCVCRTASVEEKTADELYDELANLGSHALLTALVHLEAHATDWIQQDDTRVSYATKIEKGELNPSPENCACDIVLKVRASTTAHPARCVIANRKVTLEKVKGIADDAELATLAATIKTGEVCFFQKCLFLKASDTLFEVLKLKPDGKQSMEAKAFAAGIPTIKHEIHCWSGLDV